MKKIFYLSFLFYFFQASAQTGLPASGVTAADNLIKNFMTAYSVPGLTFAMSKNGKMVYMRSFGFADLAKTVPTQPYNLFRIASDSKPITSIAIMKLMQDGSLNLSQKAFGTGGILEHHPEISTAVVTDSRVFDITVQQLLEHTAGWDRAVNCNPNPTPPYPYYFAGCDPINNPLTVAMELGVPNPLVESNYIRYLMEKGLDFTPGTKYAYSNIGFLVLGEIVKTLTGKTYEEYVQSEIFEPLGIFDAHIGGNLLTDKMEREAEYFNGSEGNNLSVYGDGTMKPWAYGGMNVKAMSAHGGWIITARDLLTLINAVDGFSTKPDILSAASITTMTTPSSVNANYAKGWQVNTYDNWWHTGAIPGTAAEIVRASNGYNWVIILNYRVIGTYSNNFWSALDNLGWNVQSSVAWGTYDLMQFPTINASGLTFSAVTENSMNMNWTNGNGGARLVIAKEGNEVDNYPLDGMDYSANSDFSLANDLGGGGKVVYNGTGNNVNVTGLDAGKTYTFRVIEFNKSASTGNNALYQLGNNTMASRTTAGTAPVKISKFEGAFKENEVALHWVTAQELNSLEFAIERSVDGNNFESIARVPAKGNSQVASDYFYRDAGAFGYEKLFYRLKAIDKNGAFEYSNIITIKINSVNSWTLTPNPAKGQVWIKGKELRQIQLHDMNGRLLAKKEITGNEYLLDISAFREGTYVVRVLFANGQINHRKLIIRK